MSRKLEEMKTAYDRIEVPEELRANVLQSIEKGKQAQKKEAHMRTFARVTGMAAAAAVAFVVGVNASPTVAQAMEQLPVLGAIVKVVSFTTYSDEQENKQMEATVKVPEVTVIGKDGKALTEESKELNAAVSGYLEQIIADYENDVAAVADGDEGHEAVTSDYRIVTDNDRLFSLRVDTVIAMGGSDSFTKIYNIDKNSGNRIELSDLFREGSDYKARISDSIKEQMRAQMKADSSITYFLDDGDPEWDFDTIKDDVDFYVSDAGMLTLVFDKYEVAPGYMGMVEFSIPTETISDLIKEGYLD